MENVTAQLEWNKDDVRHAAENSDMSECERNNEKGVSGYAYRSYNSPDWPGLSQQQVEDLLIGTALAALNAYCRQIEKKRTSDTGQKNRSA